MLLVFYVYFYIVNLVINQTYVVLFFVVDLWVPFSCWLLLLLLLKVAFFEIRLYYLRLVFLFYFKLLEEKKS